MNTTPITDHSENLQRRYAVFISYRHTDNQDLGRQWATWLHQALETYEIPRDLVGIKNNRDEPIPKSLYPVFRDEEELAADPDLNSKIFRALENSALLVVVCSPRAVQSRYVEEEIRYFKKLGKTKQILALIVDGEPNVSSDPARKALECFPEPLRFGAVNAAGDLDWTARTEIIAADTRPEGAPRQGWTTGAGYREALEAEKRFAPGQINVKVGEYEKRLQLAKLKIVAGALGLDLGVVTKRDQEWQLHLARARAQRLRKLAAAFAGIALLAAIAGLIALHEKNTAVQTLSQSYFLQAGRFIAENNRGDALAYLARSIREDPKNGDAVTRLTTLLTDHSWMVPTLNLQHSNTVEWAEFSPDGRRIVTASDDHTAQIWDAQTGAPVTPPLSHTDVVWHATFSQDGKRVATASADKTAKVWEAGSGKLLQTFNHSNTISWVAFSPDGSEIATASWDYTARVWNARTGKPVTDSLTNGNAVEYVEFSPNGKNIVTASEDGYARVWDARTGVKVRELKHGNIVIAAHYNRAGTRIVTASWDNTARIWDVPTGGQIILAHQGNVEWAEFSPDGTRIVTGTKDGTARVWDAQTGRRVTDAMKHGSAAYVVRFSPDGKRIVTASFDHTARVWDAETGEALTEPMKQANFVDCAQFSPDGRRVLTASYDGSARVWDVRSAPALSMPLPEDGVLSSAFSPDGTRIVTASANHTARIWDSLNGRPLTPPMTNGDLVLSAQFSPDGRRIVTGSQDGRARIWDARIGVQVGATMTNEGPVNAANFSPDGKWIVTASKDKTARIWNAETGRQTGATLTNAAAVWAALFSPDGRRIVTGSGDVNENAWVSPSTFGEARLWDARTGAAIPLKYPIKHDGAVIVVQFSPDGKRIVTGSKDHRARVWDAQTGAPISEAMTNGHVVVSVQFSPDGRQVLTASADHTARLWDTRTGEPVTEPLVQGGSLLMAQFSPDARWIVTAAKDQTVQIWGTRTAQALAEPFWHHGPLYTAQFGPDGKRVVTAAANDLARVWDVAPAPTKNPDWLLALADAVSGETLSRTGALELTTNRFEILEGLRKQLNQEPTEDDWIMWGRWFLADPAARTLSPFSHIVIGDYIGSLIQHPTPVSLRVAELLAAGNTNFLEQIAEARKAIGHPD